MYGVMPQVDRQLVVVNSLNQPIFTLYTPSQLNDVAAPPRRMEMQMAVQQHFKGVVANVMRFVGNLSLSSNKRIVNIG